MTAARPSCLAEKAGDTHTSRLERKAALNMMAAPWPELRTLGVQTKPPRRTAAHRISTSNICGVGSSATKHCASERIVVEHIPFAKAARRMSSSAPTTLM